VGKVAPDVRRLMTATEESFWAGAREARAGRRVSDIGHAVQRYVEQRGFSVVRELCGHGVGRALHEEPSVPNFGPPGRGAKLVPGMTLAIEPMVNTGGSEVDTESNGWTVVARDGRPSAHYENTVLVTEGEPEILTLAVSEPAQAGRFMEAHV
jgi:methionyl aminopeptidase